VQTLSSDFNLKKEKFIPIYVGFYDAHDREDSDIHVKDIDIFLPSNNKLFHGIPETIQLLSLLAKKKTNLKSVLTNSIFYKKRIKKLGLEKNIEITDWLTNITKTEYLKGTKIVF